MLTFTHYTTFTVNGVRTVTSREETAPLVNTEDVVPNSLVPAIQVPIIHTPVVSSIQITHTPTIQSTVIITEAVIAHKPQFTTSVSINVASSISSSTAERNTNSILWNALSSSIAFAAPISSLLVAPVSSLDTSSVVSLSISPVASAIVSPVISLDTLPVVSPSPSPSRSVTFIPVTPTRTTPTRITLGTVVSSTVLSTVLPSDEVSMTGSVELTGSLQPQVRTFFTLYTYFTSFLQDGTPIVSSRMQTITHKITVTPTVSRIIIPSPSLLPPSPPVSINVVTNVQPTRVTSIAGARTIYRTRTIFFTSFITPGTSTISSSEEVYSVIMPPAPTRVVVYQDGPGGGINAAIGINAANPQPTITLTGNIVSSVVFGSRTVLYIVNTGPGGQQTTTTVDQQQFRTSIINGQPTVYIHQTATRPPQIFPTTTQTSSGSTINIGGNFNFGGSVDTTRHTQSSDRTPQLGNTIKLLGINTSPTVVQIGGNIVDHNRATADERQTTFIDESSTVVSGTKTIFGGLYTPPVDIGGSKETTYINGQSVVHNGGVMTRYITYVDSTSRTIVSTRPTVMGGTRTRIVSTNVYPRRTMLITVIGDKTVINYVNAQNVPLDATDIQKIFGTTAPVSPPFATDLPHITKTNGGDESTVLLNAGFGNSGRNPTTPPATPKIRQDNEVTIAEANSKCKPACNMAAGQMCKEIRPGIHRCECRPGYVRNGGNNLCKAVRTYLVKIPLVKMDKTNIVYKSSYQDRRTPEYRQMSIKTREGDDYVFSHSNNVGRAFYGSRVTSFANPNGGHRIGNGNQPGIVANIAVHVNNNSGVDETMLRNELLNYVRTHNYTLGNTDLKTSAQADAYTVEDFDECSDPDFNDCSENAFCKNTLGSYTCSCKELFSDENPKIPGRMCADDSMPCDFCNFHGVCVLGSDGHQMCKCNDWYLGKNCQVNGFALAIILPIIIGLLLIAAIIWLCCCCAKKRCCVGGCCGCCKPKHNKNAAHVVAAGGMFPIIGGAPVGAGTLDKKAMIAGDTSSESSGEQSRMAHVADVFGGTGTNKSRKSGMSYEDRSISAFVTEAPVLIPRAKHQHSKQYVSASTENIMGGDDAVDYMSAENKLMNILEGEARHERNMTIQKEASSFATMPSSSSSSRMAKGHSAAGSRAATIERAEHNSRSASATAGGISAGSASYNAANGYSVASSSMVESQSAGASSHARGNAKGGSAAMGAAAVASAAASRANEKRSAAATSKTQTSSSNAYYSASGNQAHQGVSGHGNGQRGSSSAVRSGHGESISANGYGYEAASGAGTSSRRSATYGSSSREAGDMDTFNSRFETGSNGRYGNTTMSVARSFDETTIHPDTRRLGAGSSYYSSSTKGRSNHLYRGGEEPYHTDMDEAITDVSVSTMMVPNSHIYYEHDSDASESTNPSAIMPKVHNRRDGKYEQDSYYSYSSKIEIGNTRRESHT